MDYEQIKYEAQNGILTITLNRPDKLNAFTGKMLSELLDAMDRADRDDDVRAVVFTGAGRGFCAGADLAAGAATFDAAARGRDGVRVRRPACVRHLAAVADRYLRSG